MRRIGLVLTLSLMLAGPHAGETQHTGKVYRIGVLEVVSESSNRTNVNAFQQGLKELGYIEGRNFAIEYRSADGRAERFPELARELVGLKVDVFLTRGTPAALVAKRATESNSNRDGVEWRSAQHWHSYEPGASREQCHRAERPGDRQLLREMVPQVKRVAFLFNMSNPVLQAQWKEAEPAALSAGLRPQLLDVRTLRELDPAFDAAVKQRADAIIVGADGLLQAHRAHIVESLAQRHLPTISREKEFVDNGGLISYGIHYADSYRRAAVYVDKILRGAKPADLPIEQPTKFELVINFKTAKALGLTIPQSILVRADEIIQ